VAKLKKLDGLSAVEWANLSDEDVLALFLTALETDEFKSISSIEIVDQRFKGPIVMLLRGGATLEGTLIDYTPHSVNVRTEDGVIHLKKSEIQGIRRPKQKPRE
jgi:hypothetical protein